jgi:uncharacterized protein YbcI
LNAALANELGVQRVFTGRGATKSRAFVHQDLVVCVFEDGATRAERNLAAAGKADLVRIQCDALQRAMGAGLIAAVERLTHRTVHTFLGGTDEEGGSSIEAFLLEPELPAADPAAPGARRVPLRSSILERQGPTGRNHPRARSENHAPDGQDLAGPAGQRSEQMEGPSAEGSQAPLTGGRLLAQISTSIVAMLREHYGRGPMKAKTYALDDIVVVVMRGSGFTALEQTIMDSGQPGRVVAMREEFQNVMAERYRATIENLTGRKVVAFLSQAHVEPDITVEMFFVDGPLPGFGALEVIEPE